jgi:hypothetical protein
MKIKLIVIGFIAALFSNFVSAEMAKVEVEELIASQEVLEVIYVDHEKRWVRLKDKNGFARKVDVGDDVQNFDQVELGDIVTLTYSESINIRAYAPGVVDDESMVEAVFGRAEKGEKPGKFIANKIVLVSTIEAIDLVNNTVTLKGAAGNTAVFPARNPDNLTKVKVGDKVVITHTEAVSIEVTSKKDAE